MSDPVAQDGAEQEGAQLAQLRILSGDPDAEELAALTAVLSAAMAQLATQARRREQGASAWQRSQRQLRRPLEGDWSHSLR